MVNSAWEIRESLSWSMRRPSTAPTVPWRDTQVMSWATVSTPLGCAAARRSPAAIRYGAHSSKACSIHTARTGKSKQQAPLPARFTVGTTRTTGDRTQRGGKQEGGWFYSDGRGWCPRTSRRSATCKITHHGTRHTYTSVTTYTATKARHCDKLATKAARKSLSGNSNLQWQQGGRDPCPQMQGHTSSTGDSAHQG